MAEWTKNERELLVYLNYKRKCAAAWKAAAKNRKRISEIAYRASLQRMAAYNLELFLENQELKRQLLQEKNRNTPSGSLPLGLAKSAGDESAWKKLGIHPGESWENDNE
jgi:hypothetical protein